jgi:hypothetical protein
VPLSGNQSRDNRGINWLRIVRTLLVQVLVLIALSGAFIRYVNWSSERALAEFLSATEPSAAGPGDRAQSATPVQNVKGKGPCPRKV